MSSTPKAEPTTEITLRDGSGTVMVREAFADRFPALAPTDEMLEVYRENLGDDADLQVRDFQRVKMPSGELNSFQVTIAGEEKSERELVGVLVAIRPRRSYWQNSDNPDGSFPDCFSSNGKTPDVGGWYHPSGEKGAQNPTGLCANCPMSQRGSDPKSDKGQACKEQRLLFLMKDGDMFPVVFSAPRTSVNAVRRYAMDLVQLNLPYYGVETKLGLEKDTSSNNQVYNRLTLTKVGDLTADERKAAKLYGAEIKAMIDAAVADFSTAAADEPTVTAESGISVGEPVS